MGREALWMSAASPVRWRSDGPSFPGLWAGAGTKHLAAALRLGSTVRLLCRPNCSVRPTWLSRSSGADSVTGVTRLPAPPLSACTVYDAAGNSAKVYLPLSFVVVEGGAPDPVNVTFAFRTAFPSWQT